MNIIEDRLEINVHLLSKETSYNEQNVFMWSMIFYLVAFFIMGVIWMIFNKETNGMEENNDIEENDDIEDNESQELKFRVSYLR